MTEKLPSKNSLAREILEWALVIIAAIVISVIVKNFGFEHYKVDQSSMQNTLYEGESLIVNKFEYLISEPKRLDVIILEHQPGRFQGVFKHITPFPNPDEIDYVKRILGLPGETIDISNGKVYINKKEIVEPYIIPNTDQGYFKLPAKIPKNKYFVMGDNRPASRDSRTFGFVDRDKIKGKVSIRIWPLRKIGKIDK